MGAAGRTAFLGEDLLSLYVSDEHRAAVLAQALAASGARGEASVLFAHSASEECGEPAEALAEGLPPQALRVPDALAGRRLLGKALRIRRIFQPCLKRL